MTIARFSWAAFLAIEGILVGLPFLIWRILLRDMPNKYGVPASHDPFTWFYCALTPFFLWFAFVLGQQFLSAGRRAVWIEESTLRFFPRVGVRPIAGIPLADITGFSPASHIIRLWVRANVIRVETVDGKRTDEFLTWPLCESANEILARLNQALAESRH